MTLPPAFPYYGGKSRIAPAIWERFGTVDRYIEPFAGSLAVLFARPEPFRGREIVNDVDGLLVNTWRALAADPEAVARWVDWPRTESDLHARHAWLVGQRERLTARLEGDPDWYDAKAAGWWLWGISLWIGGGWCAGTGSWGVVAGELVGVGAGGRVSRKRLFLDQGKGVHRGDRAESLVALFRAYAERLRDVDILAGDWRRAVTGAVLGATRQTCAVYLDPPYAETAGRTTGLYAQDSLAVAHDVRTWALEAGSDPRLRIALSGYEGEHAMPVEWECPAWSTAGGMAPTETGRANRRREGVWFSPAWLRPGLWSGR